MDKIEKLITITNFVVTFDHNKRIFYTGLGQWGWALKN